MSDYYDRLRETLQHLGGRKVTADEVEARRRPVSDVEASANQGMFAGLDAAEIAARHRPLAGTNTVSQTVRGSWAPVERRERIDWSQAGWTRDPATGRFVVIERHDDGADDFDG
jgi:hypothetical protein